MMGKHTPGPWIWNYSKNAIIHPVNDASDEVQHYGGILVCESVWDEPNARLIAAAPDLLEALEKAIPMLNENYIWHRDSQSNPVKTTNANTAWHAARAAIAKAKGEG